MLDWSLWAGFHQRNLSAVLAARSIHLAKGLALPEQAAAWDAAADDRFGRLRLYPLVMRARARDKESYSAAVGRAIGLLTVAPELVTATCWRQMLDGRSFKAGMDSRVPREETWFRPELLRGTTLEVRLRAYGLDDMWRLPEEAAGQLLVLAPHDYAAAWEQLAQAYPNLNVDAPAAAVVRAFAPFSDYDLRTLEGMLWLFRDRPADYELPARKLCKLDADRCAALGAFLRDHNRAPEAAAAYDHFIAGARDLVGMSNHVGWVVRYYHDVGRVDRAMTIAKAAADVYSSAGLETLGDQLYRMSRFQEAEAVYRSVAERYDSVELLLAFKLREAQRLARPPDDETRALERRVFGASGRATATAASLGRTTTVGLAIETVSGEAARAGLRPRDVIVALDGIRVGNRDQYRAARGLRDDPDMIFTVWRGAKYVDVPVKLPLRWVSITLRDDVTAGPG